MVYLAYHPIDRKSYVGSTSNFEERKRQHRHAAKSGQQGAFLDAIRRDGFSVFEWHVLSETMDPEEMRNIEARFIRILRSDDTQFGYNKIPMLRSMRVTDEEAARVSHAATTRAFNKHLFNERLAA